jgi:hypothetical protein
MVSMWKVVEVKGVKFLWCVQDGDSLRIHDLRVKGKHKKKFFSVYRSTDVEFSRVRVSDDITQQEVHDYIYDSLKWGITEYAML